MSNPVYTDDVCAECGSMDIIFEGSDEWGDGHTVFDEYFCEACGAQGVVEYTLVFKSNTVRTKGADHE